MTRTSTIALLLALLPACGTTTITPWKVADTACDVVRTAAVACQLVPSSEPTSGGERP